MTIRITGFQRTSRFEREFKRLDPQTQGRAADSLKWLLMQPSPAKLRHHTLSGYTPTIHVLDVSGNHAHQITFRCDGSVAILLRVATHKEIKRDPGDPKASAPISN